MPFADRATAVLSYRTLEGEARLGVLAKRRYRLERGRPATPLAEPAPLRLEIELAAGPEDSDRALVADTDAACFLKPLTDVLVSGSVRSTRGPVPTLECGVAVGPVRKAIRAIGDRTVVGVRGSALEAGRPEPFTTMPLEWARAYGGRDRHAEHIFYGPVRRGSGPLSPADLHALGSVSYPRNRWGRGFFVAVDVERLVGEPLPNLAAADAGVAPHGYLARDPDDWLERPVAAGFGPIDVFTFPRCMFSLLQPAIEPGTRLPELADGSLAVGDLRDRGLTEPPDPRYFNAAPSGLAVARLAGHERAELWNLHPEHERLEFELPRERPRMLIEPPSTRTYELEPALGTVWLRPDEDLLELTWSGSMPVAAVFPTEMCREMRHAVTY